MSLTDEERYAIVQYRIEKAHNALNDIRKALKQEMWAVAANRMYYALYYAMSAVLIHDGHKVSSHKGVMSLMNLHYVKTGRLTSEDGHLFGRIFAFRQGSDYDDFIDASQEDVMNYQPQVETLVAKIIALASEREIK